MKRHVLLPWSAPILGALSATASAQLTIHLTFDSSVTGDPRSAMIQSATTYAAAQFQNNYTNPITINIRVVAAPGTGTLGMSSTAVIGNFTYAQVRGFLTTAASTPDDTTAVASLGVSDPTGGKPFLMSTALAKALGQRAANDPSSDGTFTFGAGQTYTFDPNNRAVPGAFDFIGVAEHELSEIMGRIAGLSPSAFMIQDLFRYSAPGTRVLTAGTTAYFSINGGATNLHNFNTGGGDPGDWDSSTHDAFNASTGTGVQNLLSETDLRLMDVLGYRRAAVCYPNCDHSTTAPCLNVNDFTCFLAKFATGDTYANCDHSTTTPVLNVNDFTCFLNSFAGGCSGC